MTTLLVLAAIVAAISGLESSHDFRGGSEVLYITETKVKEVKWEAHEKDDYLKITWYSKQNNPRFSLAYDNKGYVVGVSVVFYKSEVDKYIQLYQNRKGIFEYYRYKDQNLYRSTVLFYSEATLRSGGKQRTETDPIADGLWLKQGGNYEAIYTDGCDSISKNHFTEQSCKSKYGLVSSSFTSKSECESLSPFYTVYHPETRKLIGFGWASFTKFSNECPTFYESLSKSQIKDRFPNAPSCLKSHDGLTTIDVWLSYKVSYGSSCSSKTGKWYSSHCSKKQKKSSGSDSSDSSSSSDSSDSSDSS